jgi:DNA-binding beta-propeller fold protein YncE
VSVRRYATVLAVPTAAAAALAATAATAQATADRIGVRKIPVGGSPNQVAIDHRARSAWVAAGRLIRISEATQRVTARITVSPGVRFVAADPVRRMVWASSCAAACSIVEVSEAKNRVVHRVRGIRQASGIGVDPRRGLVWVADSFAGGVHAISEATRRVVRTVPLHFDSHHQLGNLAINPSTGTVWVAVIPGDPSTTSCRVSEISESRHGVIHVYPGTCQTSAITAFDPARGTAWLDFGSFRQGGTIEVINIARHTIVRTFSGTMAAPDGLAIDGRTRTVVATGGVGGGHQDTVLLISESSGQVRKMIPAGLFPALLSLDPATGNVYVPIVFKGDLLQFHI